MSKTRLDLSGINLNDLRRPRRSKRQGLHIEPQPTIEVIETRPGVPYKYICVCLLAARAYSIALISQTHISRQANLKT